MPASVSLKGLSREYGFERPQDSGVPPKKWLRVGGTLSVTSDDLLKRWNDISGGRVARAGVDGGNWSSVVKNLLGFNEQVVNCSLFVELRV